MMVKQILNRKKVNRTIPFYTGIEHDNISHLQLFKYNGDEYFENTTFSIDDITNIEDKSYTHWLNIHGLHEVEKINQICSKLNIHNLVVQDILDVNQRAKVEEYDGYWFFTLKSMMPKDEEEFEQEQLSFIVNNGYLVSFQERKGDHFEHIRERLRKNIGIVRQRGSDYLLYLLLEAILDNYFKTTSSIEQQIDDLGLNSIESDPSPSTLQTIENYKKQIFSIKRTLLPVKEIISRIERKQFDFIQDKHLKYYLDLKDLCLSLIDDCDDIYVRLESSSNLFFSVQGHRMNQVMKTLTVVATIFIPLTFIAGVYGMNFVNMPELHWQWGYWGVWGIMILVLLVMLTYFKRKRWF